MLKRPVDSSLNSAQSAVLGASGFDSSIGVNAQARCKLLPASHSENISGREIGSQHMQNYTRTVHLPTHILNQN